MTYQSGSHVVPILLTVYEFQPNTGGKVQMKEKVQTNTKPMIACFSCSRMLPRGRQITKKRSNARTARDHSATIPEKNTLQSFGLHFLNMKIAFLFTYHVMNGLGKVISRVSQFFGIYFLKYESLLPLKLV